MVKKQKSQIKAVIFDTGGVLELPKFPINLILNSHLAEVPKKYGHRNKSVHEYIANKLKILLDQWFDSIDTTYAASITGKISESKTLDIISKNVKVSKTKLKKIILKAYKTHFKPNKELYNFAFKLKKQGYKIAILSDQWYLSKQALIPKKLYKKFDKIIVSCDVSIRKPNPEIYKLTLKKLGVNASESVFIDNQIWNIKPAKQLGMQTILYKDNRQVFRQLSKIGVK